MAGNTPPKQYGAIQVLLADSGVLIRHGNTVEHDEQEHKVVKVLVGHDVVYGLPEAILLGKHP